MRVAEPSDPAKSVDVGNRAARDRALRGLTVSSLMLNSRRRGDEMCMVTSPCGTYVSVECNPE